MSRTRARWFVRIGLLLLLGAMVTGWVSWRDPDVRVPGPLTVIDFVMLIVGGVGLLLAFVGGNTLRPASDAQAIARWVVNDAEWQRYAAACRPRETMPGALPGAVLLDMHVPSPGVDIVALRRGFRVGDAFHEIGTLGAEVLDVRVVDAPAAMFEFNMRYVTGRTSSVQRGVRIPIAASAGPLAQQVERYWIARAPLQVMTMAALRARERGGWWLAVVAMLAFLCVLTLFVLHEPPACGAIAPVALFALASYGFARANAARIVRWRREGQR